jgi:hypothetical protein
MPSFLDRALLDSGKAAGNRDDNARLGEPAAPVHLLNEVPEHSLGYVEVGNYSVFQRPYRDNISWSPADHSLSFKADRDNLAGIRVKRDYRRFIEDDPATSDIHKRVRGAEVDSHVTAKKGQRVAHLEREPSLRSADCLYLCCFIWATRVGCHAGGHTTHASAMRAVLAYSV